MALTVGELRAELAALDGGTFTLGADDLGLAGVQQLLEQCFPAGTLSVESARSTADLVVTGTTAVAGVSDGTDLGVTVSFSTNSTGTSLTGLTASVTLGSDWTIATSYLTVDLAILHGFGFDAAALILAAEPDASGASLATTSVSAHFPLSTSPQGLTLSAAIPTEGATYRFAASFTDVALGLDDLSQFGGTSASDFAPLGSIPGLTLLGDLSLTRLEVSYDAAAGVLTIAYVELMIADAWPLLPGVFEFTSVGVGCSIPLPLGPPGVLLTLFATMQVGTGSMEVMLSLPSLDISGALLAPIDVGAALDKWLPNAGLEGLVIDVLYFWLNADTLDYQFRIGVSDDWTLGPGLVLDTISLSVSGNGSAVPQAAALATFTLDPAGANAEFGLGASYQPGTDGAPDSWMFAGGLVPGSSLDLPSLLDAIVAVFGVHLPASLRSPDALGGLVLQELQLELSVPGPTFTFAAAGSFVLADVPADATVILAAARATPNDPFAISAAGTVVLSLPASQNDADRSLTFELDYNTDPASTVFTAVWKGSPPVPLADIARVFAISLTELPADVMPELAEIAIVVDGASLVIAAATTNVSATLATVPGTSPGPRVYVGVVAVALDVTLSDLPVIGGRLAAEGDLCLTAVQLIVASGALAAAEVAALIQALPAAPPVVVAHPQLPSASLAEGVSVTATLVVDGREQSAPISAAQPALSAPPATGTAPLPAAGMWLPVGRTFGPVDVRRVGVTYLSDKVWLLLDAGFTAAGLAVDLQGLGIGFTLTDPPSLTPALHGMAVSLQAGAVTMGGGLIQADLASGTVEYDGAVLIRAAVIDLVAMGSWATIDDQPSLFVFAMLNEPPLGGPPFFYVTGLAAGFGYNRSLTIPSLGELPSFPFVAAAISGDTPSNPFSGAGSNVDAILQILADQTPPVVPEAIGEYWLSAGVRFSSFELLQTFALLNIEFGAQFAISMLGVCTVTVPTLDPDPILSAELALEASFTSESGLIAVMAELTPNSYILSSACHLTGGFAFLLWTRDVTGSASAGEFVVTLGGYNTNFVPPAYYPQVPRVGANWQVSDNLTIKAGLYVALTPSVVMAGGSLEATWQGGGLRAWFDEDVDFLLGWKPFHYAADAAIQIGVSYRIHLVTTLKITVHLGVQLSLWGPPFTGVAHVDLDVVSFTITFGNAPDTLAPIPWAVFKKSFLPDPGAPADSDAAHVHTTGALDPAPKPTSSYCGTRVVAGLLVDLTQDTSSTVDWVVDAAGLALVTYSVFPCATATMVSGGPDGGQHAPVSGSWSTAWGVGPIGLDRGQFRSAHTVQLHRLEGGQPDTTTDVTGALSVTPILASAPPALWSSSAALTPSIAALNRDPPAIADILTGVSLTSNVICPDHTPEPVDTSVLLDMIDPTTRSFSWTHWSAPSQSEDQTDAMAQFTSSLTASDVAALRSQILAGVIAQGWSVPATVNLDLLAAQASNVLDAPPVIATLGG